MAEELLHRPDVVAALEEVRREGVTERVAPRRLRDPSADHRHPDDALEGRLVEVMPPALAGLRVPVGAGRREHPLPPPILPRVRILAVEGVRQLDPPCSARQVALVLPADVLEMGGQRSSNRGRQHSPAVPGPLPPPDKRAYSHSIVAGGFDEMS